MMSASAYRPLLRRRYDSSPALWETGCIAALSLLWVLTAHSQGLVPTAFLPLRSSIVRVEAEGGRGLSLGSGVTVAPGTVVTNCHVTRDATAIRIAGGGNLWQVTGQHAHGNHDLCFLRVPTWNGTPVALGGQESLRLGQPVAAIGFTGGMGMSLKFGNVRALHLLEGARVIESDTAFTSGASGGGLFDASGALVGLLTFRSRGRLGSYYSLPVRWIRERLPRDDQWADVHPLHDAVPFWQRDAATQPFFMRAVPLYSEGRWIELIRLAEHWSSTHPRDAEPLRVRGDALHKLDRQNDAVGAFKDALRLAPDDRLAWYGLALAYARMGNPLESMRAESALASFDPDLAARLHDVIEQTRRLP